MNEDTLFAVLTRIERLIKNGSSRRMPRRTTG